MTREEQMHEAALKASQTAELLVTELRELHTLLCVDGPRPMENRLAEAHALGLLNDAVALNRELKGLCA